MIDNALWGCVQPKGAWLKYSEMMRLAEAQGKECRATSNAGPFQTKFKADREASVETNPVLQLVSSPVTDMFTTGEPNESSLVPVFVRRSFVDDICFSGEDGDSCLATPDRLLTRFAQSRISSSFTKSIFCQPKVDFMSHEISPEGIKAYSKKLPAITELSFPTSKHGMQSFRGALSDYSRFIQDFAVYGEVLYQLKEEDFGPKGDHSVACRAFRALQVTVDEAPILKNCDRNKEVHVMIFANEWALSTTLMKEHEGMLHPVRCLRRVLKEFEMNYHSAGRESLFGRAVRFAVLLSPWHLKVQRVKKQDVVFAQLLQSSITNFVNLEESLAPLAPPSKCSPTIRMDLAMLYARQPREYRGFVVPFDGSAKTE
ncbi:hypothetical protein PC129_g17422 [Phytophthora cactorum]|uniref:Reverse transcriptase/retrotransposon-derived protein RNase H-like domain-containing protein n=1 Tax=Phytophthora cactorum TaxID=29920 RepID=A0A8T1G7M7_9STRA|nr:hypothetical protein PC111_g17781 [Phytophthora cactorum]KAG2808144.1 hypothetical protein PC112_g17091 [Phytophthora cactorum]KAG2887702.1 hypothetical protein PC114_g18718 [Phytophthora cactorum]KAG2894701.1 hypothetical protein PC115_g18077 [Phytophthora cactorum]KAG2929610.1 hypothetical protein PC117_g13970 [Phytophthora cactorum]